MNLIDEYPPPSYDFDFTCELRFAFPEIRSEAFSAIAMTTALILPPW
jgi:hypothetical protein